LALFCAITELENSDITKKALSVFINGFD